MNKIGDRIRKLRKDCHWTQEYLASRIHATKQGVSNWERNIAKPELKYLISLAEVFRVRTDYLLGLDDSPRYMHAQGGEQEKRGKHWDWVFQKSYDLIDVINSDYKFKINNRFLTKKDKDFISHYVVDLYKRLEIIELDYEEQIKELQNEIDKLKGITNKNLERQFPLF
ncbi:MAG TPA: helix-turn-helix transcriptional regulator [Bacillus sp. (in: firmicutes)]|uniref:helix-turn-helix domain-containing protein n=1 Tax=Bacillus litorisediminis TaxID=2922713 RepID=UPI001FAE79BF|nr:helix-turn-helix transcriptional regulator [Bacillus litorisediminis]HWO75989.1 helix-turn-helix transcriptional regulator [Bacillus sp. (in: firmicutes)]